MNITWITDAVEGQLPSVSPDAPALAMGTEPPLSYGQLRDRELQFARALMAAGVVKGDRVAILMRNSTDYVAWYLAIGRVGAMSVRLNWRLTAPELEFQLQDSSPKVVVFDVEFAPTLGAIRSTLSVDRYVTTGEEHHADWTVPLEQFVSHQSDDDFPSVGFDDPLTLMYTSGTTGRPKGVVITHGNSLWIGAVQGLSWGIGPESVAMTMGPLFHAGGFEVLLLPALIQHGLAVTYPSGGFSLPDMLQAACTHQATVMLLYSFMLYEIGAIPNARNAFPSSLQRVVTGGDVILPSAYDVFEQVLPGVNLTQSYSLTEGGAVAVYLDHSVARGRESSVGRPQPMTQVQVLGPDRQPVPTGEVGEIWVRNPGVSVGYWGLTEDTAATFIDGWCKTGDLGRVDADGFLTLAGRSKDMIRSGGENIYPAELEKVLSRHEAVHDVAVVGVPDPTYVEVGCAVVVVEDATTVEAGELRDYLAGQLAKFKIPKHYVFVEALPRNVAGKVLKNQLRADYAHLGRPKDQ